MILKTKLKCSIQYTEKDVISLFKSIPVVQNEHSDDDVVSESFVETDFSHESLKNEVEDKRLDISVSTIEFELDECSSMDSSSSLYVDLESSIDFSPWVDDLILALFAVT